MMFPTFAYFCNLWISYKQSLKIINPVLAMSSEIYLPRQEKYIEQVRYDYYCSLQASQQSFISDTIG